MPAPDDRSNSPFKWWSVLAAVTGSLLLTFVIWLLRRIRPFQVKDNIELPLRPSVPPGSVYFQEPASPHPSVEPERQDVSVKGVLIFGAGLTLLLGLVLAALTGFQIWVTGRWPDFQPAGFSRVSDPAATLPPAPRPEAVAGQTLQSVRATEAALLNEYGWVDRDAGIVRIPIDRAMQLIVERGLPSREASFQDSGDPPPLDSSSGQFTEEQSP